MVNTCSIKFLKNAHIGAGIRMTGDRSTTPFDNKPMKGLKIIDYNKLGFKISHESLPKSIWVDFDQLPLNRLTIKNGVIEDEITFVENIVNHRMQLIKTLDTEYIDLIYSTKELDKKEDEMVSVLEATPGNIYVGARCEEGAEMIFLGDWFTKKVERERNWGYYDNISKFHLSKQSPRRVFFAIPDNELSNHEERELETQYDIQNSPYYKEGTSEWLNHKAKVKACTQAKKDLLKATPQRYKIKSYSVTSKVIKKLIKTEKSNDLFTNKEFNREVLYQEGNRLDGSYYGRREDKNHFIELKDNYNFLTVPYIITNYYYTSNYQFMSKSKTDIDNKSRIEINSNFKLVLEDGFQD